MGELQSGVDQESVTERGFKDLANSIPQIVWISGPSGGETHFLNDQYYEYTGLSREISGLDGWNLVVHPDDREHAFEAWNISLANHTVWVCELRLRNAAGQYRWHLSRSIPIFSEDGELTHWVATSTDIDDQKEAEETLLQAQKRSSFLLKLNDLTRAISDPDEVVRRTVKAIGEHMGVNRCSYLEANLQQNQLMLWESYSSGVKPSRKSYEVADFGGSLSFFETGKTLVIEDVETVPEFGEGAIPNFKKIEVRSLIAVPIMRKGALSALFSVNMNVPRKWAEHEVALLEELAERTWLSVQNARAEQRLIELNAELERRVDERTAELMDALRQLESFAYTASHDLRAPLRAINATSGILREDFGELLPHEGKQLLILQAEQAKRMSVLIDQLLQFSRLGRQEIEKQLVDLTAVAGEVANEIACVVPNINFEIGDGLSGYGDPKLLKLVFSNLLENAVKFSPSGGKVRVYSVGQNGSTAIVVEDEGVGFDMQFVDKIWIPFNRLVRDEEVPGTGIGLSNVQRIVQRHGGKVWAYSEPGKGSKFFFTLWDAAGAE